MRATTTFLASGLSWFLMSQVAWPWCDPILAIPPFVDMRAFPLKGAVGSDGLSSFGGVSLSSNPREAEAAMGRIGIVSVPTTFVSNPNLVAFVSSLMARYAPENLPIHSSPPIPCNPSKRMMTIAFRMLPAYEELPRLANVFYCWRSDTKFSYM